MKLPLVVYVDDEPTLCRLFELSMQHETAWQIMTFTEANEALEFLRRHPVDLLLCDFRLPGMTGLQLLAELKDLAPPCVMISGDHGLEGDALDPRVKKVVRKPFRHADLTNLIRELLDA